jgi:hypothetical protein
MMRQIEDRALWQAVQRIVYPRRFPSGNPPFPQTGTSPKRRPASWLYHTLLKDPALRAKVIP